MQTGFTPVRPMTTRPQQRFGNDPAANNAVAAPSHKPVGVGQTLEPVACSVPKGVLGIIKKEDSRAGLKRDIWTIFDPRNSQTYSAFLDGTEEELVAMYAKLAQWGVGTQVKVSGVAAKPVAAQRNPFLMIDAIEKL